MQRRTQRKHRRGASFLAIIAIVAMITAACSNSSDSGTDDGGGAPTDDTATVSSIGKTEGQLNLIAWEGYVEDGSNYTAYDWVTPFEDKTGCTVKTTYADTSDEMVRLITQAPGEYDGVSASGNASNRLIAQGTAQPVDTALFPEFANVIEPLQEAGNYYVDGKHYGVPYMYGPNFLMYNPKLVSPAPTSWDVVFEADSPYGGQVTAYDDPIYIADAAMYLKTRNPELGIDDPYELNQEQFDAAVELLKQQRELLDRYWSLYTVEIDGFEGGDMAVGTAWPLNLSLIEGDFDAGKSKMDAAAAEPVEGMTGWADTWMLLKDAPHQNCMLEWMNHTMDPQIQATVAEYYGAAGSNVASCSLLAKSVGKDAVDSVRYSYCGNADFLGGLYLWKTPCVEGTECIPYDAWQTAWTEITGA